MWGSRPPPADLPKPPSRPFGGCRGFWGGSGAFTGSEGGRPPAHAHTNVHFGGMDNALHHRPSSPLCLRQQRRSVRRITQVACPAASVPSVRVPVCACGMAGRCSGSGPTRRGCLRAMHTAMHRVYALCPAISAHAGDYSQRTAFLPKRGRTVRCARAVRKVGCSPPPGVW